MGNPADGVPPRLPWPFVPRFLPIWYAAIGFLWWKVFAVEASRSDVAARAPLPASLEMAASLAVAGKLACFLTETGFYSLLWRSRGHRLPFWRFFCIVVSASMADLLASTLLNSPRAASGWLWPLVGLQMLEGTPFRETGALRAAFGTFGVLTAIRILITAQVQAKALGRSLGEAVALTAGVWLATRLMIFWTVDLIKGMSPLGG